MQSRLNIVMEQEEPAQSDRPIENGANQAKASGVKRFREIDRNQLMMRSVNVEKLIGPDHPARAIWAMVSQLDWSRFEAGVKVEEGRRGRSAHDPRLLAALWIYGYSEGVHSARELSEMTVYEPGCQWLSGIEEVNYHSLSDFRTQQSQAIEDLFVQVLGRLSAAGLTELKRVAQDGTKIRAQASSGSFRGKETLEEHLQLAKDQVTAMNQAEADDASQRQIQARKRAGRERQARLEAALEELKQYEQDRQRADRPGRVSWTDPEARVMKQPDGGYAPSYNVQICTDAAKKIIVAVETTQSGNDYEQLKPGIEAIEANTGRRPEQMVVDGGYIRNDNIEEAARLGMELIGPEAKLDSTASLKKRGLSPEFYPDRFRHDPDTNTMICPANKVLPFQRRSPLPGRVELQYRATAADCSGCPFRDQCCPRHAPRMIVRTEESERIQAFRKKMASDEVKQIYRTRSEVAETPNAWIKGTYRLRQFRLRGLAKVRLEALWASMTYNILQWKRLIWNPQRINPVIA